MRFAGVFMYGEKLGVACDGKKGEFFGDNAENFLLN